jgi:oligopeptide transport system substrate-binding protein
LKCIAGALADTAGAGAPRPSIVNTFVRLCLIPVLTGAIFLGGCSRRETAVERGNREGILYKGSGTEPESIDPHVVRGITEWTIVGSLFEGLTVPAPDTDGPAPGVAEGWDVSADGLVYTFHLRPEARWSDGDPVTAEDFAYSAQRLLAPAMGSAHAEDTLMFIRGARAFQTGRLTEFSGVGVRVVDARTLEITLEHPAPFFPEALFQFYPVKRAVIEKFGAMTDRDSAWTKPGNFVGNGPFTLGSWRPGQELVIVKNPRYWDAAHVRLHEVHFLPYENPATEETAFRNGQLHLTYGVPMAKLASYQREQPGVLKTVPDFGNYFYSLNVKRPPFNDPRVRRALAFAIDRDALAHRILGGGREPATSFTPPGLGAYRAPEGLVRFDPAEAKRLLAEAGFPEGRGFPHLEILIDSRDPHRLVGETVQQMWRQHLGIDIGLRNEETRALIASKRAYDFDLVRGSWNASSYRDPHYFLVSWLTGGLYNEAGWSDAKFDALIDGAVRAADPARRLTLFRDAEAEMLQEMPVIPLFYSAETFLMAPSVHGWSGRPFSDRLFKLMWLE